MICDGMGKEGRKGEVGWEILCSYGKGRKEG